MIYDEMGHNVHHNKSISLQFINEEFLELFNKHKYTKHTINRMWLNDLLRFLERFMTNHTIDENH